MSLYRYSTASTFPSWSTLGRLASLQSEVNRFFDASPVRRSSGVLTGWTPALDLYDEKENLVVTVELPGLKKEDVEISLHEGVLTVSGERKHEAQENPETSAAFRSERFFGKFERSVTLPVPVDGAKVSAAYQDGILTVTLPKAEDAKPRRIGLS